MIKLPFKSKKTKVGFKGILVFSLLFSFISFWFCKGLFGDFKKILLKKIINTCNIRLPKSSICDVVGSDKSFSFDDVARAYSGDLVGLQLIFFLFSLFSLQHLGDHTNPSKKTFVSSNLCSYRFLLSFFLLLFILL
jgi:uncharacterized membrane protein